MLSLRAATIGQEQLRGSPGDKDPWMTGAVTAPRDGVGSRVAARLAWGAAALTVVFTGVHLVLWTLAASVPGAVDTRGETASSIPFAVMGALIVARRPGNRIGWLFVAIGFLGALVGALDAYALYTLAAGPSTDLPGAVVAAWGSLTIGSIPLALLLLFVPLLYPTGRLPSPRWRPVAWLGALALLLATVADALHPGQVEASEVPVGQSPLGIAAAEGVLSLLAGAMFFLFIPLALAAQASLLVRFRRARGDERQQLKWLAYAILSFAAYLLLLPLSLLVFHDPSELVADLLGIVPLLAVPVALGVAVLRYRLYDIDRIINRTLVYGLLTAVLGAVYAGVVLVLGQVFGDIGAEPPSSAVAGATLAAAALFRPARRRIQAAVDRRFNRRKYNAAKTIEAFSTRLRDQLDLDTLSTELLAVVDQTMEPTQVSLWLRPSAPSASGTTGSGTRPTPWAY
jgi:hypothetical protein